MSTIVTYFIYVNHDLQIYKFENNMNSLILQNISPLALYSFANIIILEYFLNQALDAKRKRKWVFGTTMKFYFTMQKLLFYAI